MSWKGTRTLHIELDHDQLNEALVQLLRDLKKGLVETLKMDKKSLKSAKANNRPHSHIEADIMINKKTLEAIDEVLSYIT